MSVATTTEAVDLTGVLRDNQGNALANAPLDFFYKLSTDANFTFAGTVTTDATGTAILTVTLQAPAVLDLEAVFNGTATYSPSSGEIVFDTTVSGGTQTKLTVFVNAYVSTDGMTAVANVTGTLKDINGNPISGQTIQILVDGTIPGTSNPTAVDGSYSVQVTGLSFGTHTITATFGGNTTYASSSGTSQFTVTLGKPLGAGVSAAAVVGLIALATVGYALSRKKKRRR